MSKEDGSEMGDMHAFPTVEQLQAATEEDLRANGFGYRAGYIAEAARQLHDKGSDSDEKGRFKTMLMLVSKTVCISLCMFRAENN